MPQHIVGHKSIETTRGYLHPDTRHLTSAAVQANAFLDAQERHPSPARDTRRRASGTGPMIHFTKHPHGIRVPAVSRRFATGRFESIATAGASATHGPRKPSKTNDEARRELASHQGFSVGMTGFEPATP